MQLHHAAEADWTTFSYAKPDGVSSGKGFVALGRKDIVRGVVQVVKKDGGENNLHYHTGIASFWMVLKGRVRFYGPDDVVIGEFGPHGGHHHAALLALLVRERRRGGPRNPAGRGVRSEKLEKSGRTDVSAQRFDPDTAQHFEAKTAPAKALGIGDACVLRAGLIGGVLLRGAVRRGVRAGRAVLQGQDHPHRDLAPASPAAMPNMRACSPSIWAGTSPATPASSCRACRARAGSRHQLSLHAGAAGRHHHRHRAFDRAAGAAVGQQGRALRDAEVQLARRARPRRRHVHLLAHLAGQDLGRHAEQGDRPSAPPARARRWTPIRRCSTSCSAPRSR